MSVASKELIKPRRSALYMPCSNMRALEKAQSLDCDVILFDLEDAVAVEQKSLAREQIVAALEQEYGSREKIVRINGLNSEWGKDDVRALATAKLDALLVPKVESCAQLDKVIMLLGREVPLWVMIETPLGVMNVASIAAHSQVKVLVMGTNDLAKDMRVEQSADRAEFSYAFGACIMAARAYGCDILDGVYNQLDDDQGLERVCLQGKGLGFDGKTLIHPRQLATANGVFSPSVEQITAAEEIVAAWQANADKGVLVVNGKLVELLHVQQAQRLLSLQASIQSTQ